MLHRHIAKLAVFGLFLAACSGAPTDNTASSSSALNGNGHGGGDDCQGDDDSQSDESRGDDGQGDDGHGHCVQRAHVQLITMDSTDLVTGTNLVTLQTQQYQLVFGSTRLGQANLGAYPQSPIKTAAQGYDSALLGGNQATITTAIQDYANLGGRADVAFRTNVFGQRTLTSFTPVAN